VKYGAENESASKEKIKISLLYTMIFMFVKFSHCDLWNADLVHQLFVN
jgi:hypothetical protein